MALLVYFDDIVLAGNDAHACDEFKNYLHSYFSIKDLGPLKYFLDPGDSFLANASMLLR